MAENRVFSRQTYKYHRNAIAYQILYPQDATDYFYVP